MHISFLGIPGAEPGRDRMMVVGPRMKRLAWKVTYFLVNLLFFLRRVRLKAMVPRKVGKDLRAFTVTGSKRELSWGAFRERFM